MKDHKTAVIEQILSIRRQLEFEFDIEEQRAIYEQQNTFDLEHILERMKLVLRSEIISTKFDEIICQDESNDDAPVIGFCGEAIFYYNNGKFSELTIAQSVTAYIQILESAETTSNDIGTIARWMKLIAHSLNKL